MDLNKADHVVSKMKEEFTLSFLVNGQKHELPVQASARLVDILREKVNLTGTKVSCGIGRCGACSVLLDGQLVNACLVMAYQVNGKSVLTIEGVGTDGNRNIQEAFLHEGGFQCGYCTSGMIMAVKALVDAVPNPTEEDIKEALSGNLCRCTGYGGIIRAVQRLANGNA
ncbi:(2Fe-2S)-binding protein [Bacillus sp. 37MA]|uniref:(2Fe-2S)-binding protein n=1 Tax=Bacillus sp. 37MA TaxID=1132442 RepID=UPI00036A56F2|nr:(2Fe-2S)-binding protein [Bacillus sp. 37MA]